MENTADLEQSSFGGVTAAVPDWKGSERGEERNRKMWQQLERKQNI